MQKTVKMSIWIQQHWDVAQDSAFMTRPVWWVLWPRARFKHRGTHQRDLSRLTPHLSSSSPRGRRPEKELPVPSVLGACEGLTVATALLSLSSELCQGLPSGTCDFSPPWASHGTEASWPSPSVSNFPHETQTAGSRKKGVCIPLFPGSPG